MIKFDVEKLTVDVVLLKSCTTALGGSVRIVDEENSDDKEVYKKINVPMAIVRTFSARWKTSNYMKPVVTAIVKYDGHPVALERHPLGTLGARREEGLFEDDREWLSESIHNIKHYIKPLCKDGSTEWYFDGKFMYSFTGTIKSNVDRGVFLSKAGNFRAIEVTAIQLSHIHDSEKLDPSDRTCLAYVAGNGEYSITPPIWKRLADVGTKALSQSDSDEDDHRFDAIDEYLAVNLAFALKAGQVIGSLFGHEEIEPLQLPELMIRLNTVNLPKISSKVKSTYDIGMTFTQSMAWLIGMSNRINSLDSHMALRNILKYLTTKGIFRKNMFTKTAVFKAGFDLESVPVMTKDEALDNASTLSVSELMEQIRAGVNQRRSANEGQIVGSLFGAE